MSDLFPAVAFAGEALIDLIRREDGAYAPCLGGSVYNQARALARQGLRSHYLNPLSADAFGRALAAQLAADGVQAADPQPRLAPTALAVVDPGTGGGPPRYAFYREGVADRDTRAEALIAACARLPGLALVACGGLALDPRDAGLYLPWLDAQRAAGRQVALDVNMRPQVMPDLPAYRAQALAALARADLAKVSDEDLQHLGLPGDTPQAQAAALFAQAPTLRLLALTLGPEGACLLDRGGLIARWREPRALQVADTVGAGDCFFAGLIAQALRLGLIGPAGLRLPQAEEGLALLRHAVAAASLCVQQRGCVPPDWDATCAWRDGA